MGDRQAVEEAVVVTDAGPILHLHWVGAGQWALPERAIIVVESVWGEIERQEPAALEDPRLRRVPDPPALPTAVMRADLHGGERAALAHALLARESSSVQVLSDDTGARTACSQLGLQHTGTVGLILEAHASGAVTRELAEETLRALPVTGGLWLHPRLLDVALLALRQRSAEE